VTAAALDRAPWTLRRLLHDLVEIPAGADRDFSALTLDSREVTPGALFCALSGHRGHGLEYAPLAAARGAAAVIYQPHPAWGRGRLEALAAEIQVPLIPVPGLDRRLSALAGRFYGEPSARLELAGVTGTNGKTSVAWYLAQALAPDWGLVGTLGYGLPGRLRETAHTTPDAIRTQALLAELLAAGCRGAALEVSSHALDQYRVEGLVFRSALFTNLSRDHLDYHGDMAAYAAVKARLFRHPGLQRAIVNADDPEGRRLLAGLDPATSVAYGLGDIVPRKDGPWLRGRHLHLAPEGLELEVTGSFGRGRLRAPLLGRFNALNLLAVLGELLMGGLELDAALARLARVHGAPGRMEAFHAPGRPRVVVDYAHTPDALAQALAALRAHGPRRLICVFGAGGERDRGKRPEMGAAAEGLADRLLITNDNPRREAPERIIEDILGGLCHPEAATIEPERGRAIAQALDSAQAEDIVLVAGKGHERVQHIGDLEIPFSDRERVAELLGVGA